MISPAARQDYYEGMYDFLTKFINGDMSVIQDHSLGLCFNMARYMNLDDTVLTQFKHGQGLLTYSFFLYYSVGWKHYRPAFRPAFPNPYMVSTTGKMYPEGSFTGYQLLLRKDLAEYVLPKLGDFINTIIVKEE